MDDFVVILLSKSFAQDGTVHSGARSACRNQLFIPGIGSVNCSLPRNRCEQRGKKRCRRSTALYSVRPITPSPPRDLVIADRNGLELSTDESNSVADGDPFFDDFDLDFLSEDHAGSALNGTTA
jgi:hypothetical protein